MSHTQVFDYKYIHSLGALLSISQFPPSHPSPISYPLADNADSADFQLKNESALSVRG